MHPAEDDFEMGAVVVTSGPHKGRIGDYDDDDSDERGRVVAVVYFGGPLMVGSVFISKSAVRPAHLHDLRRRREELHMMLFAGRDRHHVHDLGRADALAELLFVEQQLNERLSEAVFASMRREPATVFISHSSTDKDFVRTLAVDLQTHGVTPWLDEWRIEVGDSIPTGIARGLSECRFAIVVLTQAAVSSKWVEREWHDKYWDELSSGEVAVLPVLLEDCELPRLLRTKKYADFRSDYSFGLGQLLRVVLHPPRRA